jgi:hypothetical protein
VLTSKLLELELTELRRVVCVSSLFLATLSETAKETSPLLTEKLDSVRESLLAAVRRSFATEVRA